MWSEAKLSDEMMVLFCNLRLTGSASHCFRCFELHYSRLLWKTYVLIWTRSFADYKAWEVVQSELASMTPQSMRFYGLICLLVGVKCHYRAKNCVVSTHLRFDYESFDTSFVAVKLFRATFLHLHWFEIEVKIGADWIMGLSNGYLFWG